MKIICTTDAGEVIETIYVATEIGDLTKRMPQAELIDRVLLAAKQAYLKEVMAANEPPKPAIEYFSGHPMLCACCGEASANPGQFVRGGRWVCTEQCRKNLRT